MTSFVGRVAAAVRFLTVFPLPGKLGTTSEELTGSLVFFPLTGLLIGGVTALAALVLHFFLPPLVCAVLVVGLLAVCSGGLHLDGLADTADGFFSSRPRERILAIMRDSATGAMGGLALIFVLLCKIASLAALTPYQQCMALLLMPLAGRAAILFLMALQPYARKEGGLGTLFYNKNTRRSALFGLLFFTVFGLLIKGIRGAVAVVFVAGFTFIFGRYCNRKIGGATGDTLGAVSELAETIIALFFAGAVA